MTVNLFVGWDDREEVGVHTFTSSVMHRASEPVSITPLRLEGLRKVYAGGERDGTNAFIYSRFLIPYLMQYRGHALFVDGADMVCNGDIAELWAMFDPFKAVQVVKHQYKTRHPFKYLGTSMEAQNRDYPGKNWSSVMLINCAHYAWRDLTPERVEDMSGADLHRFSFIQPRYVGNLPAEWNWLADEYGANAGAKLLHWTAGIPGFPAYKDAPMADAWRAANERITYATP